MFVLIGLEVRQQRVHKVCAYALVYIPPAVHTSFATQTMAVPSWSAIVKSACFHAVEFLLSIRIETSIYSGYLYKNPTFIKMIFFLSIALCVHCSSTLYPPSSWHVWTPIHDGDFILGITMIKRHIYVYIPWTNVIESSNRFYLPIKIIHFKSLQES